MQIGDFCKLPIILCYEDKKSLSSQFFRAEFGSFRIYLKFCRRQLRLPWGTPLSRLLILPLPPPLSRGRDPWYRPFGHSSRTSILFEVKFRHYECNMTPGHVFSSARMQRQKNCIAKNNRPSQGSNWPPSAWSLTTLHTPPSSQTTTRYIIYHTTYILDVSEIM